MIAMANPILKVYLSHAPEAPTWALDGVVDMLRQLQAVRGKPYELRYGYALGHGRAEVVSASGDLRHGSVNLAEADLVFVLVTQEYFHSEYINMVERPLLEERLEDNTYAGVIPILFDPTDYSHEWLAEHDPRTIPFGAIPTPDQKQYGSQQWLAISEKIAERLLGIAAIQRSRQREDRRVQRLIAQEAREKAGYGSWPYIAFATLLAIAVGGTTIDIEKFLADPRGSSYYQERTFRDGLDLSTRPLLEQESAPGTDDPGSPDPGLNFDDLIRPDAPPEKKRGDTLSPGADNIDSFSTQ